MNKQSSKTYLELEWKKGLKLIPLFFLILVITLTLLAGAVLSYSRLKGQEGSPVRIDVAIAGGSGDAMTEKALLLVQQMEVVRSITKFHRTTRAEADQKVADGTYDAAVYLNDNMYQDINQGRNTPVLIRMADKPTFESELFRELVLSGIDDLQTAEASIYAVYDMSREYPMAQSAGSVANRMAREYIKLFLSRGVLFKNSLLAPFGEMTGLEYAGISILLILPLILGVGCASFYGRDERVTGLLLARRGVPLWLQSLIRVTVLTGIMWLFMLLAAAVIRLTGMPEEVSLFRPPALLAAAFALAAYIHLVYSALRSEGGSFLYLIVTAALIILGGGLFPPEFMPAGLARATAALPFAWWQKLLAGAALGHVSAGALAAVLAGAVLMVAAAQLIQGLLSRGGVR